MTATLESEGLLVPVCGRTYVRQGINPKVVAHLRRMSPEEKKLAYAILRDQWGARDFDGEVAWEFDRAFR
jgi:hypothetical protein